jgi:hypothetical protein
VDYQGRRRGVEGKAVGADLPLTARDWAGNEGAIFVKGAVVRDEQIR